MQIGDKVTFEGRTYTVADRNSTGTSLALDTGFILLWVSAKLVRAA